MNFKKGIFVLTAILLMSATTVSAFAYYGNQDVRGDAVCTDEQRMDRIRLVQGDSEFAKERAELGDGTFAGEMMRARLNQSTNEFAQERIEARQQLTDGTCDGSMPQLQVRANGRLNKNVSE